MGLKLKDGRELTEEMLWEQKVRPAPVLLQWLEENLDVGAPREPMTLEDIARHIGGAWTLPDPLLVAMNEYTGWGDLYKAIQPLTQRQYDWIEVLRKKIPWDMVRGTGVVLQAYEMNGQHVCSFIQLNRPAPVDKTVDELRAEVAQRFDGNNQAVLASLGKLVISGMALDMGISLTKDGE